MNKNEIIFLSSDEEEREKLIDNKNQCQFTENVLVSALISNSSKKKSRSVIKPKETEKLQLQQMKNSYKILPTVRKNNLILNEKEVGHIDDDCIEIQNIKSPEVVDLEEIEEKAVNENFSNSYNILNDQKSNLPLKDKNFHGNSSNVKYIKPQKNAPTDTLNCHQSLEHNKPNSEALKKCETKFIKLDESNNSLDVNQSLYKNPENELHKNFSTKILEAEKNELTNSFYNEFVDLCVSLEPIANDKDRLQKKLQKRFEEANVEYVQGEKFKNLVEKCKMKINAGNLYLVAKEVCDELCSNKALLLLQETIMQPNKINVIFDKYDSNETDVELISKKLNQKKRKKQSKVIKKIIKQLNLLGTKIHELEEAEVDLSDEEESSYLQLQRYRYKFCSIYKKLCKFTNQVSDANRVYSRKICFSGSKYPKINQCIEKWLNETKRFPDFTDIMKLLENQSACLGLNSDHQSIRQIAIEIFQKVGVMLQQRRKYDLWDSFCGYLDESEDPANNDPALDSVLKKNFENRVLKEKKIIEHYVEMQEKERLKPQEIKEEDAFNSPLESGNEDEDEIQEIEELISEKMDTAIEEEKLFGNSFLNDIESMVSFETCDNKGNTTEEEIECIEDTEVQKESKNNFKNCKSIKWRKKMYKNLDSNDTNSTKSFEKSKIPKEIKNFNDRDTVIVNNTKDENKKTIKIPQTRSSHSGTEISISMKLPSIQLPRFSQSVNTAVKTTSTKATTPPPKKQKLSLSENNNLKYSDDSEKGTKLDLYFEVRFAHIVQNFKNFCKVDYVTDLNGKTKKKNFFQNIINSKQFILANRRKRDKNFLGLILYQGCVRKAKKCHRQKPFQSNLKFKVAKKKNLLIQKNGTKQNIKVARNNTKKHSCCLNRQMMKAKKNMNDGELEKKNNEYDSDDKSK